MVTSREGPFFRDAHLLGFASGVADCIPGTVSFALRPPHPLAVGQKTRFQPVAQRNCEFSLLGCFANQHHVKKFNYRIDGVRQKIRSF